MAHVQKRNGRWQPRYRDASGREHAMRFDRKVEAQDWLDDEKAKLRRGEWVDPAAGRRLFGDYARAWQAAQVTRATTAAQVASHLQNHVMPTFERRTLASVRASEVQAWVKGRADVLAPATVEVVYRYLAAIFAAAVEDRVIPVTPCKGIRLPKVEAAQVVPLATEEVEALIDAMPERYRALVILAAGTGLRQGEVFGLTTGAVDFLRRSLRVERQLVLLPGGPPYLAPPRRPPAGARYRCPTWCSRPSLLTSRRIRWGRATRSSSPHRTASASGATAFPRSGYRR